MTNYEVLTVGLSAMAALIGIIAVIIALRSNSINKNAFKRQGVIDLFMAWQGINEIDKNNIIGPDVVRAVNALTLTSSLWNHDVIEKNILYQTYWESFKTLYEQVYSIDGLVPGLKKTGRSLITSEIQKTFKDMEQLNLSQVTQTRI